MAAAGEWAIDIQSGVIEEVVTDMQVWRRYRTPHIGVVRRPQIPHFVVVPRLVFRNGRIGGMVFVTATAIFRSIDTSLGKLKRRIHLS